MTPAALDELKSRPGNSCAEVAARLGAALRTHGREMIGPCVVCSSDLSDRTSTRWQTKGDGWVCAVCCNGGDVIRLVEAARGCDFKDAVAWLGGVDAKSESDAVLLAREAARKAEEDRKRGEAERYREREINFLHDLWRRAGDPRGTVVEAYLNGRGLTLPDWPQGTGRLRHTADLAYCHGSTTDELGRRSAVVIHRGPAMLAAISREGRFCGLHITYLDQGGTKLRLCDPASGEALPAKKVRGSKLGGVIRLVILPIGAPTRVVIGEGIETVLSVWRAMSACGLDLAGTEFWSAIDLGNLAGSAVAAVTHPTLKTASGRARRVPGPDPDLTKPAIAFPDSVRDIVMLGDSDSDDITTRMALHRGQERIRATKPDTRVTVAFATAGGDFNDMLKATP